VLEVREPLLGRHGPHKETSPRAPVSISFVLTRLRNLDRASVGPGPVLLVEGGVGDAQISFEGLLAVFAGAASTPKTQPVEGWKRELDGEAPIRTVEAGP
jgi:hypothetical protein